MKLGNEKIVYVYERPRTLEPGGLGDMVLGPLFKDFAFGLIVLFVPIAFFSSAFGWMSNNTIENIFQALLMFWVARLAYRLLKGVYGLLKGIYALIMSIVR